jgi:NADPH:quinone reductase-like Zn-dependent oxidoreductase
MSTPDTMQAIVQDVYGPTEVLQLREVPLPVIDDDQVLVRVRAAGSFAVQIAKAYGAEVTGVCSTTKVDLVRALGADHVIDYTVEDVAGSGQRYDLIIDIAGNRTLSSLRRLLTDRGTAMLEDLLTLTELIEAGKVTPAVDRTVPLGQAPEAVRQQKDGRARGKLVVTV